MTKHRFHGLELRVRSLPGARASRVIHPPGQRIDEHRHDWPLLTIPALGGYREEFDGGAIAIDGPAVIFHPPGRCHANCIHARGMETFSIEFDPAWLKHSGVHLPFDRSRYWLGGEVALASRRLMRLWTVGRVDERSVRDGTAAFLRAAHAQPAQRVPTWFERARRLTSRHGLPASDIARRLDLNPTWLAHAYRTAAGEGLRETAIRRRVEEAVAALRDTSRPIADIALDHGFCDQSHLNRALRRLTGRTPLQIRSEGAQLRALIPA